ncbi:metal-dependent hydrolase [Halopiger djelfimassiliensis]|uniref:metal-dependent hydrolase n=1 Tax=Halopiger djelfimassiliensis TaxID=1293047 RepID=UPI00067777A4|nr:metal-dependent hydrolase [Halopiger djelfimassiliensis]
MWPWGHFAVAYLLYTAYTYRTLDRPPRALPAVAVAVGSQFPDLIDKPLAWSFGVLPGGRTFTHSLFVAALLVPAVYTVTTRLGRRQIGLAFLVGHLSHLVADLPLSALRGDVSGAAYLLWPAVEQPSETSVDGIIDAILHYYSMGPYETFQFGLFAAAVLLWIRHGMPGLRVPYTVLEHRLNPRH